MRDKIMSMIEELDIHARHVIHHALIGMTSGVGTTEEMVDALGDVDLQRLYFCLQGMTM